MPNYCSYSMRITGRPEDVDFFVRELNQFVDSLVASLNAKYNDDILNVYAWEELN